MRQKCRKSADIRHALPKPIHEDARGSLLAPIVLCQAFDTLFNKAAMRQPSDIRQPPSAGVQCLARIFKHTSIRN
jgi:hypothetical protein